MLTSLSIRVFSVFSRSFLSARSSNRKDGVYIDEFKQIEARISRLVGISICCER